MTGKNVNKTSLPEKEDYYSLLNVRDVTDTDYSHAKRVYKDFEITNLGEYYDLYALLLTGVLDNFLNICFKTWQAALKKVKVKLDLLIDINMLLMLVKGIWGGMCHSIYRYAKGNNKYIKDYDKIKDRHIFSIGV